METKRYRGVYRYENRDWWLMRAYRRARRRWGASDELDAFYMALLYPWRLR